MTVDPHPPDESPIVALRRSLNVSRADLAISIGIPYEQLAQAERGYVRHPAALWRAMAQADFDANALARDHVAWLDRRAATLRSQLSGEPES